MPAAMKGVVSFVAASPVKSFDAASTSGARLDFGVGGAACLAFGGAAHYEVTAKRGMPFAAKLRGMGWVWVFDHPGSPSHEARGGMSPMFEAEFPLPDPVEMARIRCGDPRSGSRS